MNQEKTPQSADGELPEPFDYTSDKFHENQSARKVETGSLSASSSSTMPQVSSQNFAGAQSPPASSPPQTASIPPPVATPQIADDEDLIEKEWIESAKRIVAQTKSDPHAQSEGLNAVKKDYQKKRFNIDNDIGKTQS